MLQVRNLEKIFHGRKGRVQALTPTTFDIAQGEFVCLVGASGCGKSTLLNMIAGLEEPTAGEITLDGHPIAGPGQDRGMVFQHYALWPHLDVAGNVSFGLEVQGLPADERRRRTAWSRSARTIHLPSPSSHPPRNAPFRRHSSYSARGSESHTIPLPMPIRPCPSRSSRVRMATLNAALPPGETYPMAPQ